MSVTIDSLDIQIRSSAGSAANNIDKLATSLGKLRENSKLTTAVNNLTRLKDALNGLTMSASTVGTIKGMAGALKSLATIQKASGLNSVLNSLKKLPAVVNALNPADIDAFSSAMRRLAEGLAPLAKELERVGTAFTKLPAKVKQVVSGVQKLDNAIDKSNGSLNTHSINLASLAANYTTLLTVIHAIGRAWSLVMEQAIEWDGIQARFGRAFGEYAQESLAWVDKLSEGLMINRQEFMQHSSLFAEMLKGFGINERDAGKMAIGYTELAYDIWAAYNDVYKSLGGEEGAIAAVRSAIAGEVEPIRRAGFTIVDSQLAITAANHGLAYSTQSSSEAQKSYLRYLTLVDQAMDKSIIGVYAAEMQTAEGALRALSQQVRVLAQTLGQLFIPILSKVIPYVTAFVQILTDAVRAVANFFGIELFKIDWSRNTGIGSLGEEATAAGGALEKAGKQAKALRDYTMGFDELNIISPTADTGSAGGAGAGAGVGGWDAANVPGVWDESIFKTATKQVDEIKAKMQAWFSEWKTELIVISSLFASIGVVSFGKKVLRVATTVVKFAKNLYFAAKGAQAFISALFGNKAASSALVYFYPKLSKIAVTLSGIMSTVGGWITGTFVPAISSGLTAIAGVLGISVGWVVALIAAIAAAVVAIVVYWDEIKLFFTKTLPEWVNYAAEKIGEFFSLAWDKVSDLWDTVAGWFNTNVIQPIVAFFAPIVEWIGEFFRGLWIIVKAVWIVASSWFNEQVIQPIVSFFDWMWTGISVFAKACWTGIVKVWDAVSGWFDTNVIQPVSSFFDWMWSGISGFASSAWDTICRVWGVAWGWFDKTVIVPVKTAFSAACDSIGGFFSKLWLGVRQTTATAMNAVIGGIESAINWVIGGINDLISEFNSVVEWAAEITGDDWSGLSLISEVRFGRISVPAFEHGGFLEDGLFTMNHGEIAGRFNNGKSVVANNQMIVEGIADGVYQAVVAAMSASSVNGKQEQAVNVYLDGKQIYASVKRTEAERGVSLMGNQLGYSY